MGASERTIAANKLIVAAIEDARTIDDNDLYFRAVRFTSMRKVVHAFAMISALI